MKTDVFFSYTTDLQTAVDNFNSNNIELIEQVNDTAFRTMRNYYQLKGKKINTKPIAYAAVSNDNIGVFIFVQFIPTPEFSLTMLKK